MAKGDAVPDDERYVYFIEAEGAGLVKIGIARDPLYRMRDLQCANGHKLVLRGVQRTHDATMLENHFHVRFAKHCARGEWFRLCPEIEEAISTLQEYGTHGGSHIYFDMRRRAAQPGSVTYLPDPNASLEEETIRLCRIMRAIGIEVDMAA